MSNLNRLMTGLNYQFSDSGLLKLALTHRSKSSNNYERLEFLGDSILGFVIAQWLFDKFPDTAEGKLSRMRSSLVRQESLADIARSLELSNYLILGEGEMKSGGFNRSSILSDTIESIIGAIYLDSNFSEASRFIRQNFNEKFESLSQEASFKDAKSRLQERMQKQGLKLPEYRIIATSGKQHQQQFTIECRLPDCSQMATATANSRRLAEQESANKVLEKLTKISR